MNILKFKAGKQVNLYQYKNFLPEYIKSGYWVIRRLVRF